MDITHDDISKVMRGGDPAGKFHPDVIVYSDMAVRAIIYNVLCQFKERHLTTKSSGGNDAEDYPLCPCCGVEFPSQK